MPGWKSGQLQAQDIEIARNPEQALGTGHHDATTWMLLEWLEDLVYGGEFVLDVGAGSGILAMVALGLGRLSSLCAILQTVHNAYIFAPVLDRIRPVLRYCLASFSGIASLIPADGRLLDVGCGDGLLVVYLKKIKKRAQFIVGLDIDERKIRIAKQLALPDVEFHHKDMAEMPSNFFDVVTVVHVLYLIPVQLRDQFVRNCIRVLKPGGTLVLAINVDTPRWKYYITFLQELLMVKLLSLTKGETVRFESLDECRMWITKAGATVSAIKPLDRGLPYSHAAVVAQKLPCANYPASIG